MKSYKNGEDPNEYDVPDDEEKEEEDLEQELLALEGQGQGEEESKIEDTGENRDVTPSFELPSAPPVLPSAPPDIPAAPSFPSAPVSFSSDGPPTVFPTTPISRPHVPSPPPPRPPPPPAPAPAPSRPILPTNNVSHSPSLSKADVQTILDQTEIISSAQKHAKFAISALNYDDITTAVNELKAALSLLEK